MRQKTGEGKMLRLGMDRRELRTISTPYQIREDGAEGFADVGEMVLEGHFAVFNAIYEIWDGMTESIAPGAFAASLSGDIRALINHDTTLVLGRTKAGTLELREDSRGLWGRVALNMADSDAVNIYERVKRGDVDGCSIGFIIKREEHSIREDGGDHWTIQEAELHEVSVCTFPAYKETNIAARCQDRDTVRERLLAAWKTKTKEMLKHGAESQSPA